MGADQFILRLSYDQLAWLMVTLRIPPLLGMPAALYPERQMALNRLQAGRAALQAAGIIAFTDEGKLEIDAAVSGTLAGCARALHAIMGAARGQGEATARLTIYYFSPELAIKHEYDGDALIHTFTASLTWDWMIKQCVLDVSSAPFTPLTIDTHSLHIDVLKSINENATPDIGAVLRASKMPKAQVIALIDAFKGYDVQHSLALLDVQSGDGTRQTMGSITLTVFVRNGHGVCVDVQDSTTVRVRPYSSEQLEHEIAARIHTALVVE